MDLSHQHQHFHDLMAKRQNAVTTQDGTVYSVVYVTASPTFTGVIGGYTTLSGGPTSQAAQPQSSSNGGQTLIPPAFASSSSTPAQSFASASSSHGSSFSPVAGTTAAPTVESSAASTDSYASNTAVAGPSSSSGTSLSSSSGSSSGMSTGAKAGLAIGIIAVIGIIAALLLWCLGKKRRQQEDHARLNDEKATFGASHNAVPLTRTPTSAHAPRLSLRPMSRMMDSFMGNSNRRSGGNLLNTISENAPAAGVARGLSPSPQPRAITPLRQEKPVHENPFVDPQNPFADPAPLPAPLRAPTNAPAPAPIRPPTAVTPAPPSPGPRTKFNPDAAPQQKALNLDAPSPAPTLPSSSPIAPLAIGGAAGVAAAGLAAAATKSHGKNQDSDESKLPIQKPTSPEPSREEAASPNPDSAPMPPSMTPAMHSPASTPTSDIPGGNVFRVLMDFVPSMDDELELKTGQLVRMLHEYDDGWALCIRLDRSQQGVVPRTCLAAKPSKPKPSHLNQYARGPGGTGRPMSPAGGRNSPAMGRPMSPAGGRNSPAMGRPMSPAMPGMGRPMSQQHMRPHSPAQGYGPGPRNGPPRGPHGRPMSPQHGYGQGSFNQAPRPLSPGPRPQQRSQSPGPYGANGPVPMPGMQQRRRSNSASALNVRDRRMSPPGPSNLGPSGRPPMGSLPGGMRPMSPGLAF